MPTINEMIDFCEDMAAHDCFSNEQFARREMFYAIADELQIATTNIKIGFENGYKKGFEDGYKKGIETKAADWLLDDELSFDPARPWWKCSHCYGRTGIKNKYCPDCGYKMTNGNGGD